MKPQLLRTIEELSVGTSAALSFMLLLLVAIIDYSSGIEVRTFPLYYLPIAFVAWRFRLRYSIGMSLLSALAWFSANYLAGMAARPSVWMINSAVQAISFSAVAILVDALRNRDSSQNR